MKGESVYKEFCVILWVRHTCVARTQNSVLNLGLNNFPLNLLSFIVSHRYSSSLFGLSFTVTDTLRFMLNLFLYHGFSTRV